MVIIEIAQLVALPPWTVSVTVGSKDFFLSSVPFCYRSPKAAF
jgi:hypothetical protein